MRDGLLQYHSTRRACARCTPKIKTSRCSLGIPQARVGALSFASTLDRERKIPSF